MSVNDLGALLIFTVNGDTKLSTPCLGISPRHLRLPDTTRQGLVRGKFVAEDYCLSDTIWLGASEHSQAMMVSAPRVNVPL